MFATARHRPASSSVAGSEKYAPVVVVWCGDRARHKRRLFLRSRSASSGARRGGGARTLFGEAMGCLCGGGLFSICDSEQVGVLR